MQRRGFESAAVHVPLASASYEDFFATEYPRLVPILVALLGDRTAAESLAAEVLGDVRRRWVEASGNDDPWTTRRAAMERATRRFAKERPVVGTGALGQSGALADRGLWEAVNRLSKRERWVLALHYVGDLPLAEVAAVIGCSPTTLTSLLTSAHESLARTFPADDRRTGSAPAPAAESVEVDDLLGSTADPSWNAGYHEHIDLLLRRSGESIRASAPTHAATVTAMASTLRSRRSRNWIVPAALAGAAAATALAVITVNQDDEPSAGADLETATTPEPSTTDIPDTTVEATTTTGRTEIIEPAPEFDARYDSPTGFLWTTSNWDWDDANGSCITLSHVDTRPRAEELEPPTELTGCVDGTRGGGDFVTRIGNRLLHFVKGVRPNEWELAKPAFSRRACGRTPDDIGLVRPGALYEITCTAAQPQVRLFPARPIHDLTVILDDGRPVTAALIFDGDRAQRDTRMKPELDAQGLRVYETRATRTRPSCIIATVADVSGWFDACTPDDRQETLILVSERSSYLIGHAGASVRAVRMHSSPDGAALGCPTDLGEALKSFAARALWTGLACADDVVVATRTPATLEGPGLARNSEYSVVRRRGDAWHFAGDGDRAAAAELAPCDGGLPCTADGRLATLPVGGISPWGGYGAAADIADVSEAVRALVPRPTDLASIGLVVSDHPPGRRATTAASLDPYGGLNIAIGVLHRHDGVEIRMISLYYFDDSAPQRNDHYAIWAQRLGRSRDWTVRAAYRVTNCFDPSNGSPVGCELANET